jgi:hypothetical protein
MKIGSESPKAPVIGRGGWTDYAQFEKWRSSRRQSGKDFDVPTDDKAEDEARPSNDLEINVNTESHESKGSTADEDSKSAGPIEFKIQPSSPTVRAASPARSPSFRMSGSSQASPATIARKSTSMLHPKLSRRGSGMVQLSAADEDLLNTDLTAMYDEMTERRSSKIRRSGSIRSKERNPMASDYSPVAVRDLIEEYEGETSDYEDEPSPQASKKPVIADLPPVKDKIATYEDLIVRMKSLEESSKLIRQESRASLPKQFRRFKEE